LTPGTENYYLIFSENAYGEAVFLAKKKFSANQNLAEKKEKFNGKIFSVKFFLLFR
jgi:hypothetical protein